MDQLPIDKPENFSPHTVQSEFIGVHGKLSLSDVLKQATRSQLPYPEFCLQPEKCIGHSCCQRYPCCAD